MKSFKTSLKCKILSVKNVKRGERVFGLIEALTEFDGSYEVAKISVKEFEDTEYFRLLEPNTEIIIAVKASAFKDNIFFDYAGACKEVMENDGNWVIAGN